MGRKFFIFLYPSEVRVRSLINLAVFALNPSEKWPAHVTVAGPFSRRPSFSKTLPPNAVVFALGTGNFFPQGINTVHLRIGMPGIWRIWNKPDFRGNPVPHLSLYNGRDPDQAESIFERIRSINPHFSFVVSNPTIVSSISGQEVMALREQVDTSILPRTGNLRIDDLKNLDFPSRLTIAEEALRACIPPVPSQQPQTYKILSPNDGNAFGSSTKAQR